MIEGSKSILRRVEREDLALIANWRNRPDIWQHFFNAFPIVRSGQERWFDSLLSATDRVLFVIVDKISLAPIGTVGFDRIDWRDRNAEYGNMLIGSLEHIGRGYARDATMTLLSYGFLELGLERVYLNVAALNQHAIQLYEACGFQREGILRQSFFRKGSFQDKVLMSILRREFSGDAIDESYLRKDERG
ncbi:MAG: GNAT family protein [Dehalococcoidia bacterium]|nr:GNAT family protein [Dehalococcoidia bacterium]